MKNIKSLQPSSKLYLDWWNNYLTIETMADHYFVEPEAMRSLLARSKVALYAEHTNNRSHFTLNNVNLHEGSYNKLRNKTFSANRHADRLLSEHSA